MKISKTIAFLAAFTCFASALTACGNADDSSVADSEVTGSQTEAETTEATTEEETEEATEAETEEESESETEAETDDSNAAVAAEEDDFGDITISMDGSESTEEAPVKFNEWATIGTYSATDSVYHNVALRITKVTTASDDQKYVDDAIALNNDCSSDFGQIDVSQLKVPSDCELCVVDYEIAIPANFPTNDWGVVAPNFSLSVENTDGAGFPSADGASSYIGLSTTTGLEIEEDPSYQVGNTYSFRSLYIMVKGYDKIAFKTSGYPAGTTDLDNAERYDVYFAAK